jgi:hypothetical protein
MIASLVFITTLQAVLYSFATSRQCGLGRDKSIIVDLLAQPGIPPSRDV